MRSFTRTFEPSYHDLTNPDSRIPTFDQIQTHRPIWISTNGRNIQTALSELGHEFVRKFILSDPRHKADLRICAKGLCHMPGCIECISRNSSEIMSFINRRQFNHCLTNGNDFGTFELR